MVLMLCLRINATYYVNGDRHGSDRMVVGFTTTCAIIKKLWVETPLIARCTRYNIMWFVTGRRFSPGTLVLSTNKTDRHDISEILLEVALNTLNQI